MGQNEANKVNEAECFLLWAAIKKKKVSLSPFIWTQLQNFKSRPRSHPEFARITTGLAAHLQHLYEDANFLEVESVPLKYQEFQRAHYLNDVGTRFKPYEERPCVMRYVALANRATSSTHTGSSSQAGQSAHFEDQDDPMPESEDSEAEPSPHPAFNYHDPPPPEVPPYFMDFQNQFFTQFQQVQTAFKNQLSDQFQEFNTNFQSLRTVFQAQGATLSSMDEHMGRMDNRIATLEEQWKYWTGLHPSQFPAKMIYLILPLRV